MKTEEIKHLVREKYSEIADQAKTTNETTCCGMGATGGTYTIMADSYANLPGQTPERLTGYVASIPVGLETVGSVVFDPTVVKGAKVKKGVTRLGNFFFGGSLNIMLFSPIEGMDGAHMVDPSVQTRLGNQIGILNLPYHPPKTPWATD